MLLKVTELAPLKLVPLICTLVPTGPLAGVKSLIVGAGGGGLVTVKLLVLLAVPPAVVTLMGPEPAPEGTRAEERRGELAAWVAATLVKVTALAPLKLLALSWT